MMELLKYMHAIAYLIRNEYAVAKVGSQFEEKKRQSSLGRKEKLRTKSNEHTNCPHQQKESQQYGS